MTKPLKTTKVQIAEDHQVVHWGLHAQLARSTSITLVSPPIYSGAQFLAQVQEGGADVLLCDVGLPEFHFLPAMQALRQLAQPPRVIAFTCLASRALIQGALQAGVTGYLLKGEAIDPEHLPGIIANVAAGGMWISPQANEYLRQPETVWERLTERERRVLQLRAIGHTVAQIALTEGVSAQTIYKVEAAICRKVGVNPIAQALLLFKEWELLQGTG